MSAGENREVGAGDEERSPERDPAIRRNTRPHSKASNLGGARPEFAARRGQLVVGEADDQVMWWGLCPMPVP